MMDEGGKEGGDGRWAGGRGREEREEEGEGRKEAAGWQVKTRTPLRRWGKKKAFGRERRTRSELGPAPKINNF